MVLLMQKSLSSEAWAVSGTYHTNLEWYFLGCICFTARWCLKSKNCTGWWLSSIAFQSYSVSHFTVSDCVLAFLPWKGKSPHFSQYWKAFLQCVNRPIHREVDPLGFGSTMLFSAIRCILRIVWNTHFQLQRPVIPRDHWFFFQKQRNAHLISSGYFRHFVSSSSKKQYSPCILTSYRLTNKFLLPESWSMTGIFFLNKPVV